MKIDIVKIVRLGIYLYIAYIIYKTFQPTVKGINLQRKTFKEKIAALDLEKAQLLKEIAIKKNML